MFQEISSGLGESSWYYDTISYSNYLSRLSSHATTTADSIALANLPAGRDNPVNGSTKVNLQDANARAPESTDRLLWGKPMGPFP